MTATSQQRPRSKSFGDRVRELRERARQEAGLDYQLLRFIIFFLSLIHISEPTRPY